MTDDRSRGTQSGTVTVQVQRLPHGEGLPIPRYMTEHAAGMDLYAAVTGELTLATGARTLVPTGLRLAIPPDYEGQVRPRSGLALRQGLTILNTPGTIDADYRGEVQVIVANLGSESVVIRRGDRIAQLVITPVTRATLQVVESLDETARGDGGFGHTGVNER